jgi:hypothetical protein
MRQHYRLGAIFDRYSQEVGNRLENAFFSKSQQTETSHSSLRAKQIRKCMMANRLLSL